MLKRASWQLITCSIKPECSDLVGAAGVRYSLVASSATRPYSSTYYSGCEQQQEQQQEHQVLPEDPLHACSSSITASDRSPLSGAMRSARHTSHVGPGIHQASIIPHLPATPTKPHPASPLRPRDTTSPSPSHAPRALIRQFTRITTILQQHTEQHTQQPDHRQHAPHKPQHTPMRRTQHLLPALPADQVLQLVRSATGPEALEPLLQHHYGAAFTAELSEQALAAVDDLSPSEATRLVWFLYHSHQRAPRLMQALVVPLYNGLGRLSSEELVGVLLAYAGLGAYEHELFAAISEFVWDKLPEMEPAGLAAVAWSYAVVDHFYDDEDLFNGLAEAAVARLPFFHPADLAALAWAFAQLRYSHAQLLPEVLAYTAAHVQQFSVQELTDIVWACAQLRQDSQGHLRAVASHIAAQLAPAAGGRAQGPGEAPVPNKHSGHSVHIHSDGSTSHEMDGWIAGLTGGFLGRHRRQQQEQQQESSGAAGSSGSGADPRQASPQHGHGPGAALAKPDGSLRALGRSEVRRSPSLHSALVRLCWSYGALRHSHEQMMTNAYKVLAQCSETAFSDSELAQLQQAQLMAQEMSGSGSVAHPQLAESINIWQNTRCRGQSCKLALPAHLQVPAFTAWQLSQLSPLPAPLIRSWRFPEPEALTLEALQQDLRAQLKELSSAAVVSKVTLDGMVSVPLAQRYRGRHLSWEVLEPALCLRSPPYACTGEAAVRHRLLEYRGWRPLQVPFHEWAALEGSAAKQQYLDSMLKAMDS